MKSLRSDSDVVERLLRSPCYPKLSLLAGMLNEQTKWLARVHGDGSDLPRLVGPDFLRVAQDGKRLATQTATITWVLYTLTSKLAQEESVAVRRSELAELESRLSSALLLEPLQTSGGDVWQFMEALKSPDYQPKVARAAGGSG